MNASRSGLRISAALLAFLMLGMAEPPPPGVAYDAADRSLLLFNDVALGAGKKKTFKEGDAWRIVIPDKNNQTVTFVSHGTQQFQGRNAAVLDFKTTRTTQNGVGPVSGTAFCDIENHVLVKLHAVGDADTVTGVQAKRWYTSCSDPTSKRQTPRRFAGG